MACASYSPTCADADAPPITSPSPGFSTLSTPPPPSLHPRHSAQADRASKLAELEALKAEGGALDAQLQAFADSDPDAYKALVARVGRAKGAADRWTDNVWAVKSYLINKFGKEPREVDAMMGIKDDFDYVS